MRRFRYLAVAGRSMEPTLSDGDWVLARADGRAEVGDVVVLEHPQRSGLLIAKRVARVDLAGYWLLGDNRGESTDSRHFGAVPHLIGKVIWSIRPWGRIR